MDPKVCYDEIVDSIQDLYDATHGEIERDPKLCRSDAVTALRNMADWLEKGGFPPNPSTYIAP
jgi:hypothetical protein